MRHFLRLLVTRRWGWTLIAALIILSGVLIGVSSPTIPYQTSMAPNLDAQPVYYIGVVKNGDIYIWTTDRTNPTFYVARASDFNPPIDRTKIHLDNRLSFINRSDTILVNENLDQNLHASQAHIIESLSFYDMNDRIQATYNASDYTANSSGYFDNRWWPGGSATILAGLLVACMALFVRRKKRVPAGDQTIPGWPFTNIPAYPTAELTPDSQNPTLPDP